MALLMVFGVISAVAALGLFLQLQWAFILNLSIFAESCCYFQHLMKKLPSVQKAVRNMVISIIILDSVFVTGQPNALWACNYASHCTCCSSSKKVVCDLMSTYLPTIK